MSVVTSVAKSPAKPGCSMTELFRLLSKAHVLNILYVVTQDGAEAHRFVDIQSRLHLSPNTLSDRLKGLVQAGLLTRTSYNEIPPRVDYRATPKAFDLLPVFDTLESWAERHTLKPESSLPGASAATTGRVTAKRNQASSA